jgi:hypothetical protein
MSSEPLGAPARIANSNETRRNVQAWLRREREIGPKNRFLGPIPPDMGRNQPKLGAVNASLHAPKSL